jgi:hypothetical protein
MSITVTCQDRDGSFHVARIGLVPDQFDAIPGSAYGETVRTTPLLAAALAADHGNDVMLTPTGPATALHDYDVNSVLAWLRQNMTVLDAVSDDGGELPQDLRVGNSNPDLIY